MSTPQQPDVPITPGNPDVNPANVPVAPAPAPKRSNTKLVLIIVGAVLAVCCLGGIISLAANLGKEPTKPISNPTKPASVAPQPSVVTSTTTEPPPAPAFSPGVKDYTVTLKVLKKECFGSAGCLITYRMGLTYNAATDPAEDSSYEISYKITGAEDEIIGTIITHGTKFEVPDEETLSTKSTHYTLKVIVTAVEDVS